MNVEETMLAVKGGNIITPYKIINHGIILIQGDQILNIGDESTINLPGHVENIDASGLLVCPGFIELHIHGYKGIMMGSPTSSPGISTGSIKGDILQVAQTLPEAGITSFLPTFIGTDKYENLIKALIEGREAINLNNNGAQILGLHLEGPFFNPSPKGLYDRYSPLGGQTSEFTRKPSMKDVNMFLEASGGNLRMMCLSPELDGSPEIIRELTRNGVVVSGAHSSASYKETISAVEAGMSTITHLYNGMRRQDHREPGIIEASLACDQLTVQIITDGVHVHAPALEIALRCKGKDHIAITSDNTAYAGLPNGLYVDLYGRQLIKNDASVQIVGGSLFGSVMPYNRQVMNLVECTGISIQDAILMATFVPAKLINEPNKKGSLEPGKDADLVLLREDGGVEMTICRGKVAYKKR